MSNPRREHRLYGLAIFWLVVLVGVGLTQRWLRRMMEASAAVPVALDRPLANLPQRIGVWEGVDVPLDARVAARAGNDDYLNRRYVDLAGNRFVDLFVAYTASPATMLGHRPDRCYPAIGWRLVSVKEEALRRKSGSELRCMVHQFQRDGLQSEGLVVLNYYVLQGEYTTDADDFSGPRWRRPNLAGDAGFYVAQIQIAQPIFVTSLFERGEANVKDFAIDAVELIEQFLPSSARQPAALPTEPTRD